MSILGIKELIERLKQWKTAQKGQKRGVIKHLGVYMLYRVPHAA